MNTGRKVCVGQQNTNEINQHLPINLSEWVGVTGKGANWSAHASSKGAAPVHLPLLAACRGDGCCVSRRPAFPDLSGNFQIVDAGAVLATWDTRSGPKCLHAARLQLILWSQAMSLNFIRRSFQFRLWELKSAPFSLHPSLSIPWQSRPLLL